MHQWRELFAMWSPWELQVEYSAVTLGVGGGCQHAVQLGQTAGVREAMSPTRQATGSHSLGGCQRRARLHARWQRMHLQHDANHHTQMGSIYLATFCFDHMEIDHLPICPPEPVSAHLSQCLPTWASVCPLEPVSAHLSQCLLTWANDCPPEPVYAHLSQCLPTWASVCPPEPVSAHLS